MSPLQAISEANIHIASFNIHYVVPEKDDWEGRKFAVAAILAEIDADIVAFQEMETFEGGHYSRRNIQLDWVMHSTTGYEIAAAGDPVVFPHTQPIIYKIESYRVVDQGFFFFSETPDKIYSRQWNGSYPYFCSWALFNLRETARDFYVFNIHNDFKSPSNRHKSSQLIADRIEQIVAPGIPVIVVGDFNAPHWAEEIKIIETAGVSVIAPTRSTNRIFGLSLFPAIDHLLVSRHYTPQSEIKVWQNRYNGVYPGDHFPISVRLMW